MDYVWLILAIALIPANQAFYKAGMLRVGKSPQNFSRLPRFLLRAVSNRFVISGIVLFLLSVVASMFAVSIFPLGYVFALTNATPIVLVAVFSLLFFKEKVTRTGWLGIATICVGIALVQIASA
jgi:multidrug transporter EmrE-like cation transporter